MTSFKTIGFILIQFIVIISISYAETTYFTGFTKTNTYHQYIGRISFENGNYQDLQDELGVYVTDNNNGSLLVGACLIGEYYSGYYFVNIYANDSQTPNKEGADAGDILTFKIWDKSEAKLYVLSNTNSLTRETASGIISPELPPIFQSGFGDQFGFLHLMARNQDLNESMVYFKAIPHQGKIKLIWSTENEINLTGFYIRKATSNTTYQNLLPNMFDTKGNELQGATYYYIDKNVQSNIFYKYQLIGIDLKGQQFIHKKTDIVVSQSCMPHMDLNGDHQFGLSDIIELMKRISH